MTLLVIMDPLGNVPIFLSLTKDVAPKAQRLLALQAVLVAGAVIASFALFGQEILSYLGISIPALQGSGGLLLLLVSLKFLTGDSEKHAQVGDVSVALVPLGTPLIAGPGAIAATIVFAKQSHSFDRYSAIAAALALVLLLLWITLRYSLALIRLLKEGGITLLTRIFGLLLAAISVQLIAQAVQGFVKG